MKRTTKPLFLIVLLCLVGVGVYCYMLGDDPSDSYSVDETVTEEVIILFDVITSEENPHFVWGGTTSSQAYYLGSTVFFDTRNGCLEVHFPDASRGSSQDIRFGFVDMGIPYDSRTDIVASESLAENTRLRLSFDSLMTKLEASHPSEWRTIRDLVLASDGQ